MKQKNKQRIETSISERMSLKQSTLTSYSNAINKFCKDQKINPFDFPKIGLEQIEEMTEKYILSHVDILAPKSLNLLYNAIKTWCFVLRMIKNRRLFREIKFDKSSRKMDAMTEQPIQTKHMEELMRISDGYEKVLLGLYGLCALRPSLLTQLKVKDFHQDDYKLDNGKIKFTVKNPFLLVPKEYKGNKGKITFFAVVPSQITSLIEHCLNQNGNVTPNTKICVKYAASQTAIFLKVKEMLKQVEFEGRPYLLRAFGDRLFDRTIKEQDKDLKEFMMGHKGKISAIYQMHALTQEDKDGYLKIYAATEQWINEKVFGTRSREELTKAEIIKSFAIANGANAEQADAIYDLMKLGKMRMTDYEDKIKTLMNVALEAKMKTQFEKLFLEMNKKHNNNNE